MALNLARVVDAETGDRAVRRRVARLAALVVLATACLATPRALAEDTAACWARFLRDGGITTPPGEIVTFRYVGRSFSVPAGYLWRGTPRAGLGEQDAVWISAWLPNLAPSAPGQLGETLRPGAPVLRITLFGHRGQLTGQSRLDTVLRSNMAENRDGERDAFGYRVFRAPYGGGIQAEIHVTPEPNHFFHCYLDDAGPNPICDIQRTIGPSLVLQAMFRKVALPLYPTIDARLTAMMCCALDPAEGADRVWPPTECRVR